jgi:LCP family protein required for cell wall assembly
MLITFNPNTLNATLLSIPRDSYVPIACYAGKPRSKITHAAWNGESCMIDTIENLTGITIDYYVKINFKGLVKIVDTLGGIDMDIPYSFCEQDSNRKFGNNTIYVKAGFQTLNGEQALAFSRNRHTWPAYCGAEYSNYESNDFIRGQNQQKVLTAILDKIKSNGNLQTIYNLLDVVSNSMETNMSTSEILSLYNIGKDVIAKSSSSSSITDIIGMQRLYLSGKDAYIIDSLTGMNLYFYVLYNESLNDVIDAMKINLELKEPELIKEFSFDVDEEYTSTVIGQMDYGTTINYTASSSTAKVDNEEESSQVKVPNFVGLTYSEAKEKATSLNLYINASGDTEGKVISQDTIKDTLVDTGVTIKLTFEKEETEVEESDE